jgi:hypothetical protein
LSERERRDKKLKIIPLVLTNINLLTFYNLAKYYTSEMAVRAPFFTLNRDVYWLSGNTLALIKNSRRYELKIDATFIRDKSPFKDREMLYEILKDTVDGKLETKIYDEVDHTVRVDIMYEQNKKQKAFPITLRDEEYFIAVCLGEAEGKLKELAGPEKKEGKELVIPQVNLANINRSLSKFHAVDLATTNIGGADVVNFMERQFGGSSWMRQSNYNTFLAWLTYMSRMQGCHYYFTYGVANISNGTCSRATGTICFYKDSTYWYDYNNASSLGWGKPQVVFTNEESVTIVRRKTLP